MFISAVLIIGLSGIVAQVLLLRELLINCLGNELILGILLANWVIAEACGAFIMSRLIDRPENKINIFVILETMFLIALPLSIYAARVFKDFLGIPFGEAVGLPTIFCSSFLILLPTGFSHGALFTAGCKIYASLWKVDSPGHNEISAVPIGRVYAWEIIGTVIGAIILTYIFLPYFNSFQAAFIVSVINLIICLFFFRSITDPLRYIILLFLPVCLLLGGYINSVHRLSLNRQWKGNEILDYRNSPYGNIALVRKEGQDTFYYNGVPIITVPYPDITFVQEFGNLPLLFHIRPKNILIISSGAGGLISQILEHPVSKIAYVEIDPLLIGMLKKYYSEFNRGELNDRRVNIINLDGRLFVRVTPDKYDVVLIGLSKPSDLSTNRLFTQEFFSLVKKKLASGGILSFCLPGSSTYISPQLRDLNASILNALRVNYDYVRVIPGEYNIVLASDSKDMGGANPGLISRRIKERGIKTGILTPDYLSYRLSRERAEWFSESLKGATLKVNQDFLPVAVFKTLVLWNKQFSPLTAHGLEKMEGLDLKLIAVCISVLTLALFIIFYYRHNVAHLSLAYSIATTGFFGMLANLVLIFSFQVTYGYLYRTIGLLIGAFMGGIAAGSLSATLVLRRSSNVYNLRSFFTAEGLTIIFPFIIAGVMNKLEGPGNYTQLVFIVLFLIAGFPVGFEFPLASNIYLGISGREGRTAGLFYFFDLLGSCVAGIFGGILFLPLLGLMNTCLVMVMLKVSSFFLLLFIPRAPKTD